MMHACRVAAVLFLPLVAVSQNSAFQPGVKPARVRVNILANSYRTARSTTGEQDAYIANISLASGTATTVRLIDRFREEELPIAPSVLATQRLLTMLVVRDLSCDQTSEEIVQPRTSHDIYDAAALRQINYARDVEIPCYRAIHESIQIARH